MDKKVLNFLSELKDNNNRDWFNANKPRYEEARNVLIDFVNTLIPAIRDFDNTIDLISAKECIFRIYRDVRFSKNKDPYKTNMGAYIARGGRKSLNAGYYIHLDPGQSFLAGGMYMPQPEQLKKIREEIYFNYDEFMRILNDKDFKAYFPKLMDTDKLKNPPKGYDKEWHGIEVLKHKSYAVSHMVDDEVIVSEGFFEYSVKVFQQLYKMNSFLNRIVE
jgi:uncharacterized protein (TIGR02453 family)